MEVNTRNHAEFMKWLKLSDANTDTISYKKYEGCKRLIEFPGTLKYSIFPFDLKGKDSLDVSRV